LVWLINTLARLVNLLILLRVVASWLDISRRSDYYRVLCILTEPILAPIRRFVRPRFLAVDFSPLIALIGIELLRYIIVVVIH